MKQDLRRVFIGISLALSIAVFGTSPEFRHIYALPSQMRIMQGETALFQVNYPLTINVDADVSPGIRIKDNSGAFFSRPVFLESTGLGQATVDFKLLGMIPIKQVQVDILPPLRMVAGGQSIGVVLHSKGVLVVGSSAITAAGGASINPAKDAGIEIGDIILAINEEPVKTDAAVAKRIDLCGSAGQEVRILLKRENETRTASLRPILCHDTKRYRIGLFVRDHAVGVGTMTFFDPHSGSYGALGHVITDSDTNQPIDSDSGKIVPATVSGIQSGKIGRPGEKIGTFIEEDQSIGTIEKNTRFGIYGKIDEKLRGSLQTELLDVASMNQIVPGPAEMFTVVDGQTVERFAIEIEKVNMQNYPEGKGLIIRITDERLLNRTGGIVQGMSGSPIVQNGKLIGAVTHVFVHDPTRGYGCFMDWMLMESGLIPHQSALALPQLFM